MTNAIQTFENEKYRLSIYQDEDAESPRIWDNLGTMVCHHPHYDLGDKQMDYEEFIFDLAEELRVETTEDIYDEVYEEYSEEGRDLEEIFKDCEKKALILPLFLYDHSGISMRTYTHGYHSQWDCGQVGYIYVTYERIEKEYGVFNEETLKVAKRVLIGEVETYSQYLENDVYGYILEEKKLCEHCGHMEYEDVNSCWGFYGYDIKENGMLDNIELNKEELNELIKEANNSVA